MASGTFVATGASAQVGASDGQSLLVSLTGVAVARVALQQVLGATGFRTVRAWQTPAVETIAVSSGAYRLFCESYTSGTVTYSLTVAVETPPGGGGGISQAQLDVALALKADAAATSSALAAKADDSDLTTVSNSLNTVAGKVIPIIDAGTTADLTAAIAACAAAPQSTLRLREFEYIWPAGVDWPLGMNIDGSGWDATYAYDATKGSVIHSIDTATRVRQATGIALTTICKGVMFADGLHVRKQNTLFLGCRIDGNGLLMGNTGTAAYYVKFYGCKFSASQGNTAMTIDRLCNACEFNGDLYVPRDGRGIDFIGAADGNYFNLSFDPVGGTANDLGFIVSFGDAINNTIDFRYWEFGFTGKFLDGAHILFDTGAGNLVKIHSQSQDKVRVWRKTVDRINKVIVNSLYGTRYSNSNNLSWNHGVPDDLLVGTGVTNIYLPPLTLRGDSKLTIRGRATSLNLNAAYILDPATPPTINAAGSGGSNGTYTQNITDGANTVSGHGGTVQLTVAGGIITAVTLLYPGWNKAAWPATFAVDAVTGLTGGVLNLTSKTHAVANGATQTVYRVPDLQAATLMPLDSSFAWFSNADGTGYWDLALTDGANIALNWANAKGYTVTLGGNRTLSNPSNPVAGQTRRIQVTQDGTGSRTLAYGSQYVFDGGTEPVLTTTAGAIDELTILALTTTRFHVSAKLDVKQ